MSRPPLIHLKIGDEKREVKILLDKFVSLGRVDPEANIFPVIDLSTEGVLAKSVSRRHAGIFYRSGTIIIEDQASINGTFVNGNRLAPYLPETLSNGDLLQLGRLLIEVRIEPLK
jgi:pSer/pThr/pTyr-binding forkhead associated (FHA) protein